MTCERVFLLSCKMMRNLQLRLIVSTIALFSTLMVTMTANAAPIKFNQIVQVISAKPGIAGSGGFAQLRLVNGELIFTDKGDDKSDANGKPKPLQDDRVITETRSEIVEDEVCDCAPIDVPKAGFPKYALLGLAALPLLFLIPRDRNTTSPTPTEITPTPTPPPPGMTPTPTPPPGMTPTPTPTPETTPTPNVTPTPPEPVPEPMTLLLFGTGLASVGIAARKKFRKSKDDEEIAE